VSKLDGVLLKSNY